MTLSSRLRCVQCVEFSRAFLEKSYHWLHDPVIATLTLTAPFSQEEQERFFVGLPDREDYHVYGIQADQKPVGACGLKHITPDSAEYWGYIGERQYWGQGIGQFMLDEMLYQTRKMRISTLWLLVGKDNPVAQAMYKKNQFIVIEEQSTVLRMERPVLLEKQC